MDQTFDRLQKLISQLEIQGETISQEDMNLKLLRSLLFEWKTHALIWRNKVEIETISLDDFTNSNSSTNKADNTAYEVSTAHTQSSPTSGDNLSDVRLDYNGKMGHETIRSARRIHQEDRQAVGCKWKVLPVQDSEVDSGSKSSFSDKFKTGLGYNVATAASPAVESFVNSSKMLENQEYNSENMDVTTVITPSDFEKDMTNHESAGVKNNGDAVEPKIGNPHQKEYKKKEVIDSGYSRHMTGNKCYLTEYEDYDGGFVSFGDGKGRISSKGKFDEKADEGYFVRYSMISKAMRVFNKRTMIVEETLNIRFLENAPNMKGNGPDQLFDVDSLSKSMNYVPVVTGNQTNGIAGTKDNIVAGPKDIEEDAGMKRTKVNESGASDKGKEDDQDTRSEFERLL
ncbi:hypothetical protein Tco_1244506 [Tanacetum coccineum]